MAVAFERGALLRDIPARTLDGRDVQLSDFRGRRNIVLVFRGTETARLFEQLRSGSYELATEEAAVLIAWDEARDLYNAPGSAIFIADRYGEIFFSARHPEPIPDASEVLKWLEFINAQCPE